MTPISKEYYIIKAGDNYFLSKRSDYNNAANFTNEFRNFIVGINNKDNLVSYYIYREVNPEEYKRFKLLELKKVFLVEIFYSSSFFFRVSDPVTKKLIVRFNYSNHPDCCGESIIKLDYTSIESPKFNLDIIFAICHQILGDVGSNLSFFPQENRSEEIHLKNRFSDLELKIFSNNFATKITDSYYAKHYNEPYKNYWEVEEFIIDFYNEE